jgi:hypothetical protein
MKKDTPVYPSPSCEDPDGLGVFAQSGLIARDYVAVEAMKHLIAHWGTRPGGYTLQDIADDAYALADCMFKAQEKFRP